jgi:hypothetical protein
MRYTYHRTMKSRGNGGNMMVVLMVIAANMAAALAIIGQAKLVTLKSSLQFSQGHWKSALLRTVSARAVADLKQILRTSPSCNLNALLTSASTTAVWRANRPNHYPKEWFQFKLVDENGTELPQFYSPDSDPAVWITNQTANGTALPAGKYMINVRMDICKKLTPSRSFRPNPTSEQPNNPAQAQTWTNHRNAVALQCVGSPCNESPSSSPAVSGWGGPWGPACPAADLQRISSSVVFDINADRSVFTVYFDGSLLGNLALIEPTTENELDTEERIGVVNPISTNGTAPYESDGAGGSIRMTGSNHWGTPCTGSWAACRTHSLVGQVMDTLKQIDACADFAAYVVGSGTGTLAAAPSATITPLWSDTDASRPANCSPPQSIPVNSSPTQPRAPYLRLDSDCLGSYITPKLYALASGRHAAGIGEDYSFKSVISNYGLDATALNGIVTSRHKYLVWVSDGFNMGALPRGGDAASSNDVEKLSRSHIYLNQPCGSDSLPSSGYVDRAYYGKLVVAGDAVYQPTSSVTVTPFIPQGVIDARTGNCVNITYNPADPDSLPPDQYELKLTAPIPVSRYMLNGAAATVLRLFELGYAPIQRLAQLRNEELRAIAVAPGTQLLLYPVPITDLDESNVVSTNLQSNSKRTYQLRSLLSQGHSEMLASHLHAMPRISKEKFSKGVYTLGINQAP